MNSKEIIDYLKSEASEKYKENVIKMGKQKKKLKKIKKFLKKC